MSLRFPLLLLICLLLGACNKVNQENYARLKTGMPKGEVENLLGSPNECSGAAGLTSCNWGDDETAISVQFAGDKVLMFFAKGLK
jgi:hypothetical protein